MKIIVHAGMHKTGSTALQHAFYYGAGKDYAYLYYDDPNVSRALNHAFSEEEGLLQNAHILRTVSNRNELLVERERIRANLEAQMEACKAPIMIVSGEGLSINAGGRQSNVYEFLSQYSDDLKLITYIRPPISYMESWYQERLKARFVPPDPRQLFPFYRGRLHKLVSHFGVANCEFVKFDRKTLKNGDIVEDFADRIGVATPKAQEEHGNFSLTAPAICLLYKYRRDLQGEALIDEIPLITDRTIVDVLRKVPGPKFSFSKRIMETVDDPRFEPNRLWMEKRLKLSLHEERGEGDGYFCTEQDLLEGADNARGALHEVMDSMGVKTGADLIADFQNLHDAMTAKVIREQAIAKEKEKRHAEYLASQAKQNQASGGAGF